MNFQQLKDFCNSLDEEQLKKEVILVKEEDTETISFAETTEEDLYVNRHDPEDYGPLEQLKEANGDDFDIEDYEIGNPKGTPFLYAEF